MAPLPRSKDDEHAAQFTRNSRCHIKYGWCPGRIRIKHPLDIPTYNRRNFPHKSVLAIQLRRDYHMQLKGDFSQ